MAKAKTYFTTEAMELISIAFTFYTRYNEYRDAGESGKGSKCSPLASDAQSLMAKAFGKTGDAEKAIRAFNKGADGLGNKGLKLMAKEAANAGKPAEQLADFIARINGRIEMALENFQS